MSARKKVTIVGAGMTGGAMAQRLGVENLTLKNQQIKKVSSQ